MSGNKKRLIFVGVMVFGLFMVCFNLMHSTLWGDEWVEYTISQMSLTNGEMYEAILTTFQPPLYNWLMHFWLKISDSLLWFRLFNIPLAMICYASLYYTLKKLASPWCAAAGVVLLSLSFTFVYMVQECSEYTLMMMFVFLQIMMFVLLMERFDLLRLGLFCLSGVGAIYSQYGAAFISVSLYGAWFLSVLIEKKWKELLWTAIFYGISLIVFALPLYLFFAKTQMEVNQISEHTLPVSINPLNMIASFGLLLEYFQIYPMSLDGIYGVLGYVLVIALLALMPYCFRKQKSIGWLFGIWLVSFFILDLLVEMHLYAMIHAGESRGLFFRYSDPLLPIYYLGLPLLIEQSCRRLVLMHDQRASKILAGACALLLGAVSVLSLGEILTNWQKSHEDEFITYWYENAGADVPIAALGRTEYNGRYFFEQLDVDPVLLSAEQTEELSPEEFVLIRSVWGGEEEQEALEQWALGNYEVVERIDYEDQRILDYGGSLVWYRRK